MKINNLYLNDNYFEKLVNILNTNFSYPKVYSILNIYSYNSHSEAKVTFDRNHCQIELPFLNNVKIKYDLSNFDIRAIDMLLKKLGYYDCYINQIFQFDYNDFKIKKDTFKGTFITSDSQETLNRILNIFPSKYTSEEPFQVKTPESYERIINELGVVNTKVSTYARRYGISLSRTETLKELLESTSNDYSELELQYKMYQLRTYYLTHQ